MTLVVTTRWAAGCHTSTRIAVVASQPLALAHERPDAGDRVAVHRQDLGLFSGGARQLHFDRTRGGRPDGQLGTLLVVERDAEVGVGRLRVQVVEDAGELDAGEHGDPAVGVAADEQQLAAQQVAEGGVTQLTDGVRAVGPQVREFAALGPEEAARARDERDRGVLAEQLVADPTQATTGGGDERQPGRQPRQRLG